MSSVFYVAGVVALVSTLMVITRVNAVHALLYLIVSLLSVAIILDDLGAPLVAALEVIIYAGAIMVIFVFVLMMLNLGPRAVAQEHAWLRPGMWVGPGVLAAILAVGPVTVAASMFPAAVRRVPIRSSAQPTAPANSPSVSR